MSYLFFLGALVAAAVAFCAGFLTHRRLVKPKVQVLENIAHLAYQRLQLPRRERRALDAKAQKALTSKQPAVSLKQKA